MDEPRIAIVDYEAGNLRSVQKALERYGAKALVTSNYRDIQTAEGLVFPGQGSNDSSLQALKSRHLIEPITAFINSGKPFLGICLGLQLLLESSEEGTEPGLGILSGRVRRLPANLTIPHMGWNQVAFTKSHPVLDNIPTLSYFYFVHSYYADPDKKDLIAGTTTYGVKFCSAVAWDNVIAVQFHPEKSGDNGLKLYEGFVRFTQDIKVTNTWKSFPL